jgi:hypothetical protein
VADIVEWSSRFEDEEIDRIIRSLPLDGDDGQLAKKNMRLLRRAIDRADLVPVETIDEEIMYAEQARGIQEILNIFVRVNSGGTHLTRSDLTFSLIRTKWSGARNAFADLTAQVDPGCSLGVDKDFVICGLLLVADAPIAFDVAAISRYWNEMSSKFDTFAAALRSAIDFCRDPPGCQL